MFRASSKAFRSSFIPRLFCAALAVAALFTACGRGISDPKLLVGTWRYARSALMLDTDGGFSLFSLQDGSFRGGKYSVSGSKLELRFEPGTSETYSFDLKGKDELRLVDSRLKNETVYRRDK
jgi:hypothetical protein